MTLDPDACLNLLAAVIVAVGLALLLLTLLEEMDGGRND